MTQVAEERGLATHDRVLPAVCQDAFTRAADLVLASVLVVLLSPLLLGLYLAVRLTSRGGGFFRQTRVGRHGQQFTMLKFRSMRADNDPAIHREYVTKLLQGEATAEGGLYKITRDPRVTKVGSFLRRTSLDELPQLFNVLGGSMSLVGPRPCLPYEAELFPAFAQRRFDVRPGLTGLWQVCGRNQLTMHQGLELDTVYVERRCIRMYVTILARTIPTVLFGNCR